MESSEFYKIICITAALLHCSGRGGGIASPLSCRNKWVSAIRTVRGRGCETGGAGQQQQARSLSKTKSSSYLDRSRRQEMAVTLRHRKQK